MNVHRHINRLQCHDWKQSGIISHWRYTERNRSYDGWHITADTRGCTSMRDLIDAMISDGVGATRRIAITAPTQAMLAVPNCPTGKPISPLSLRLSVHRSRIEWFFSSDATNTELCLGESWLLRLREAIDAIRRGEGDFSIGIEGGDNNKLWFWW